MPCRGGCLILVTRGAGAIRAGGVRHAKQGPSRGGVQIARLTALNGKGAVAKLPQSCQSHNVAQNPIGRPSLTLEDKIQPLTEGTALPARGADAPPQPFAPRSLEISVHAQT